jgi:hypothetical protein
VNKVAAKLLLTEIGATGGKLETFLRKNCPKQLEALVANGILKP